VYVFDKGNQIIKKVGSVLAKYDIREFDDLKKYIKVD